MQLRTHPKLMPPFTKKTWWLPESIDHYLVGPYYFPIYADCDISPDLVEKWRKHKGILDARLHTKMSVIITISSGIDFKKTFGVDDIYEVPALLIKQLPTS